MLHIYNLLSELCGGEVATAYLRNTQQNRRNGTFLMATKSPTTLLDQPKYSFHWNSSPEGYDYWKEVYRRVRDSRYYDTPCSNNPDIGKLSKPIRI